MNDINTTSSQFDRAELLLSSLENVASSALSPLIEELGSGLAESQNFPGYGNGSYGSIDENTWNRWSSILRAAKWLCWELEDWRRNES